MGDETAGKTGETHEQMSDRLAAGLRLDAPVLETDGRNRISLGRLAQHRFYLVTLFDSGQIMLTPCTLAPVGSPVADAVERAQTAPPVKGRRRPQRHQD